MNNITVSTTTSIDLERIIDLSKNDIVAGHFRLIKAYEEMGELSSAYLKLINSPNASVRAETNICEEGVDTILCITDLLFSMGVEIADIQAMMIKKNEKWARKLSQFEG